MGYVIAPESYVSRQVTMTPTRNQTGIHWDVYIAEILSVLIMDWQNTICSLTVELKNPAI